MKLPPPARPGTTCISLNTFLKKSFLKYLFTTTITSTAVRHYIIQGVWLTIVQSLCSEIVHNISSIDIYAEPTPAVITAISDVFQEPLCMYISLFRDIAMPLSVL